MEIKNEQIKNSSEGKAGNGMNRNTKYMTIKEDSQKNELVVAIEPHRHIWEPEGTFGEGAEVVWACIRCCFTLTTREGINPNEMSKYHRIGFDE